MTTPETTATTEPVVLMRRMWGHVCRKIRAVSYITANPCPECGEKIRPGHRQDRVGDATWVNLCGSRRE